MTMTLELRGALVASMLAIAAPVFAQAPKADAKPRATAPSTNTSPAKPDLPAPPPNYEYAPQGRRDPFVSLVNRGEDGKSLGAAAAKRADGAAGIATNELVVRGIVQTRGTWVAMVAGPSGKVFTVRAGDRLADGVVRAVTATSVVILQEVNDPLSLEKQREVRKFLRGGGDEVK